MASGNPSTPSRAPISHPYPPSYRSRMSSVGSQAPMTSSSPQSQAQQDPSPALGPVDYQRRRDERHQQQHFDQYASPQRQPVNLAQYPTSYPMRGSDSQGSRDYSSPSPANGPSVQSYPLAPSPDPGSRVTQPLQPTLQPSGGHGHGHKRNNSVNSVSSMASTHPALKWLIGNKKAMINRGYPAGWTQEDQEAEEKYLKAGLFDWNLMRKWRFWIRKEWWWYYLLAILLCVLVALMAIFHDEIVEWLRPVADWMNRIPAGWTIPVAVLFVLSFPPLFGHEIVGILIGVVWGLWVGFGIMSAGTLLGEIGNFYAFKYLLRSRAEKYERDNVNYACMAHVVREGGFFFIFVARLSAIPGHFTTAVFATCNMNIFVFTLACILSLPKQLIVVYLGVLFDNKDASSKSKIISNVVLAVGFILTIWSAWYIYKKMNQARVFVWRKQRMELKRNGELTDKSVATTEEKNRRSRSSYPILGGISGIPRDDEEVEMRSPMINKHQSYQSPYNIQYHPTDNMSVYDVDGPVQLRPEQERDIGYNRADPAYASTETFPEAHPTSWPASGAAVRRDPSTKSLYPSQSYGKPQPTSFPIAQPVQPSQTQEGLVPGPR